MPKPLLWKRYLGEKARERLKQWPGAFDYTHRSNGNSSAHHASLTVLHSLRIVPHMLDPTNTRSLSTTLFSVQYPSPILIASLGPQSIFGQDSELAPLHLVVPFICSTTSLRSLETVARANKHLLLLIWRNQLTRVPGPGNPAPGVALGPTLRTLSDSFHESLDTKKAALW
ncbi:hypothetical protein D9758_010250 [Tetrapyrgos nigripes]|uniref:FMN-dependent dehydrogenase domain-containing protein n=1 Tax=Tetrapyrgos nigripes TaxID=182062 RepID=A0A8H5GAC3_9AGAR|nr:hypothetical protein D9758_010250 [Tetrapyrgos nigripes]